MATDTASEVRFTLVESPSTPETAPAPPRRNYWQLPIFVLGAIAAVAAWRTFPPPPENPNDQFRRDLTALKQAIDRKPHDPAAVGELLKNVEGQYEQYPTETNQSNFLLGSARVILAESSTDSTEHWKKAAAHFARCDALTLPDKADQGRCVFRSAKATAAIGAGNPAALLPALQAIPGGEDVGERSRLIAETCLRMNPPDVKRAKEELSAYLSAAPRGPANSTAKYRLKLSELCLQSNEPEKARAWLQQIDKSASADVQALAKVQLARLAAAENNWQEAVNLFAAAQLTPGLPAEQLALIRFETGKGYLSLDNKTEAATFFEKAAADGGAAGLAGQWKLAELAARDPAFKGKRTAAAEQLEAISKSVKPGGEFRNPHVSLDELRNTFEEAIRIDLMEADWPNAMRVIAAYGSLALPPRDRELKAECYAAWAAALAVGAGPDAVKVAQEKWKLAAEEYAGLALNHPIPAGKIDLFRRAATGFRSAGDEKAALETLEKWLAVQGATEEQLAPAHLEKGELFASKSKFADAMSEFKLAASTGGPTGTIAQVKMARAYLDEGRRMAANPSAVAEARGMIDLGRNLLTQVANKTYEAPLEREAQQEALYDLGKSLMGSNLPEAEVRFRQLVQSNPSGAFAERAKLYLGSCLLLLARGEHKGGVPPADAERKLKDALGIFESLAQSTTPYMRAQADIRVVNATLLLKRYDDMPKLCNATAERYKGKPEELIVLGMLYSSYIRAERPELATRTLARMEDSYAAMPANAFPGGMEEFTKGYWQKWFEQVKRR